MKTIQMTIDEPLLFEIDQTIEKLNTTRSAFIRKALRLALQKYELKKLEARHAKGYAQNPVAKGEFDIWQDEQAWGES